MEDALVTIESEIRGLKYRHNPSKVLSRVTFSTPDFLENSNIVKDQLKKNILLDAQSNLARISSERDQIDQYVGQRERIIQKFSDFNLNERELKAVQDIWEGKPIAVQQPKKPALTSSSLKYKKNEASLAIGEEERKAIAQKVIQLSTRKLQDDISSKAVVNPSDAPAPVAPSSA
jgi:hypothetical protein